MYVVYLEQFVYFFDIFFLHNSHISIMNIIPIFINVARYKLLNMCNKDKTQFQHH